MNLELRNASKWYGSVCALRNVSLSLLAGETVVVYGDNGAGKTTLLQCLAGIIRPTSGEAICGDRSTIGVVLQKSFLYGELSIEENLQLAASLYRLEGASQALAEVIRQCGLEPAKHRLTKECSYGVLKRASIARALIHKPKVLLLDEPFNGLDETSRAGILTALRAHQSAGGSAVVITHDRTLGDAIGTRFVFLKDGTLTSADNSKAHGVSVL